MVADIIPLQRPEQKPLISVIMVSYNTGPALSEAVRAVCADKDIFELIIVDNGNTDLERQRLSQLVVDCPRARLLQGHGNIGFSRGCNYGAKLATGDIFLFLNPDALIDPGAARKMSDYGQALSRPWIVGGLLKDINGQEQRGSRRSELTPFGAIASFTPLHNLPGFASVHLEDQPLPSEPVAVDTVSGACMMMDRASFDALDGFDERYFLHVEDIDICRRARQMDGQVALHPRASVMHYGSTSRVPVQKVEWEKLKGFIRYFWTYRPGLLSKIMTVIGAPFMALAIMGRAWVLALRKMFRGG